MEEILRDGSKTAGDREAEFDQLFANLKNEEEKVSGVGSSVEALGVKHLKEMEEIARKGGDEYHHNYIGDQYFGGGGGGVLVGGTGPSRDHLVQGEGYGGGGGSRNPNFYPGLPGVILMEVGP